MFNQLSGAVQNQKKSRTHLYTSGLLMIACDGIVRDFCPQQPKTKTTHPGETAGPRPVAFVVRNVRLQGH